MGYLRGIKRLGWRGCRITNIIAFYPLSSTIGDFLPRGDWLLAWLRMLPVEWMAGRELGDLSSIGRQSYSAHCNDHHAVILTLLFWTI
jgi:hypothetical protein